MATTTNYGWTMPIPGGSSGIWDAVLNQLFADVDTSLKAVDVVSAAAQAAANAAKAELLAMPLLYAYDGQIDALGTVAGTWSVLADELFFGLSGTAACDSSYVFPIGHLVRPGHRITGFSSYGSLNSGGGAVTGTVSLRYRDSTGAETVVSAGHSISSTVGGGLAQTTGLTHDVVAGRFYFLRFRGTRNSGSSAQIFLKWVQPIVIRP